MREVNQITSRDNARLSHVRKVRDGKIADEIFLEGLRLAEEGLRSQAEIREVFFTQRLAENARAADLIERFSSTGVRMSVVTEKLFDAISDTKTSQGIVLTAARPDTGSERMPEVETGLFVYMHEVNDPSNLGAVFRTAEAAGVDGVILSKGSADAFSTKALRAAMGANLRLPVWDKADLEEVLEWAREKQVRCVAADISGPISHTDIDWNLPTMIIFGSEANGLDKETLELADTVFKIEMKNGVESLNLAVSAGITLFEAVRQRSF